MIPSQTTYAFTQLQPVVWSPYKDSGRDDGPIVSVRRNHGVHGRYRLYNTNDAINDSRALPDKIIVGYEIGGRHYSLFTVNDLFQSHHAFRHETAGNIMGEMAERIARRVTKYFLRHFSKEGRPGGIFDRRFSLEKRNDFVVAHTDEYILKIRKYPNLIILRKTGQGKYGYENIKELDGLFDYRFRDHRHILVLESKLDTINVDCGDLVGNLFTPLRLLFPEARFSYILFSDVASLFVKKDYPRFRRLKQTPIRIHEELSNAHIGTIFFSFTEARADFERICEHLIVQYRSIAHVRQTFHGKIVLSGKEIAVFDDGETPHIKLVKDDETGL